MVAFVNDIVKINFHHLKEDSLGRNHKLVQDGIIGRLFEFYREGILKTNKQRNNYLNKNIIVQIIVCHRKQ